MTQTNISARRHWCFLCLLILAAGAAAQELPTILQVDVENWVGYASDVTDSSKVAKTPGTLTNTPQANFGEWVQLADVIAINGSPARGAMILRTFGVQLTPNPQPGQAIADVSRTSAAEFRWEFLKPDGTQIGSIYVMALSGGSPSPGSPQGAATGSGAIVGGTGAFVGARGTMNSARSALRATSQAEDPSMRRINGGGTGRFLFQIFPLARPEVVVTADGLSVFHADFSLVTAERFAKPGETLTLYAKGLGPTSPTLNPGDPFPNEPLAVATSPIEVLVDGRATPAINQVGVPGTTDTYRIDFLVPDTTATGMIPIQLSAAWFKGGAVRIPVQ